jgi:hypothetical protein
MAASAIPMSDRHNNVGKAPIASVSPFITMSMTENSVIPATAAA